MDTVKKRVLVVDDDPAILEVIDLILTDEGYEVERLLDGKAVLKRNDGLPDLVLLDIWMSGSDGRDICRFLKKQLPGLPVILVSAKQDVGKVAAAVGADDFLSKPFDVDDLLVKVRGYLTATAAA